MTTPSPYETRGWRGRLLRAEAVVPQQAVPSVVAAPAAASREPSGSEALPPGSMRLALEGAAGSEIIIFGLNDTGEYVTIDGRGARRTRYGNFKIPMQGGGRRILRVTAWLPGYPTVRFRGVTLHKSPRPPVVHVLAFYLTMTGVLFCGVAFGWGFLTLIGVVATYVALPLLLKRTKGSVIPLLMLLASVGLIAVGIAGLPSRS